MGVRKSDDVETFDLDLIWSFCWLRSPLSYCCLAIFQIHLRDSASTNDYQMVENMPFHSPSHQLYLGLPHFSYCSSYSMLQCFKYPCCPSVTSNHVMSIEPGKEHRARLYMLIVLAVKINQRSAHIVHKARLVETQKLSSKSQQKHMNSQYKCHQRPPIVICGPTPLRSYAHQFSLSCPFLPVAYFQMDHVGSERQHCD